jgi:cystathionine beta-synthase
VILPDGGRAYLSKIFNDAWMDSYGFLERAVDKTVGDVLLAKDAAGEMPPFVVVEPGQKVREAIALLHQHSVSQLPVMENSDVVGSVGERGLLRRAIDAPAIMDTVIAEVMEEPFPAVATTDSVREAVELLAGERQALTVTEAGRPMGILTRADLLESLVT